MSRNPSEISMVLITRKDLKLSPGKLAAQASHAAVNCALTARKLKPTLTHLFVRAKRLTLTFLSGRVYVRQT